MKSLIPTAAFVVLLRLQGLDAAPSSADYQAAIREATEAYRGDCAEGSDIIVWSGFYMRPEIPSPLDYRSDPFPAEPFTLRGTIKSNDHDSHAWWLEIPTPNQSMKPTAPWRNNFIEIATDPARGLSLSR
jgi:hypothetical protein